MSDGVVMSFLFKGYTGEAYGGERSAVHMLAAMGQPRPIVVLNTDDELASEFRARGVEVRIVTVPDIFTHFRSISTRQRLARTAAWIAYNARAYRLLRLLNPSVVHCNDVEAFILVAPATFLARKRVVMHVRCERRMRWFHQLSMLLVARVVPVSRGIADIHLSRASRIARRRIRRRTTVLHNGVVLSEVDARRARVGRTGARATLGVPADERVVLLVGSLEPRKGQLDFLEHVAPRLAALPDVCVYLLGGVKGNGDYQRQCRGAVVQRALQDRVKFVGYTAQIFDWYEAADIVALTSYQEGLARTALEAGAFARPLVAHSIPGMDEAVANGRTGILVPPGAWEHYADALFMLLEDEAYRMRVGSAARRHIEERFDIRLCAEGFEAILEAAA